MSGKTNSTDSDLTIWGSTAILDLVSNALLYPGDSAGCSGVQTRAPEYQRLVEVLDEEEKFLSEPVN